MVGTPRSLPEGANDDGEEWQKLLDDIDAYDVPIDMLKYLKAHMKNGTSFLFPVKEWIESGADPDRIEHAILEWYSLKDDEIAGSDFVVDINKLRETVKAETKKTLRDL